MSDRFDIDKPRWDQSTFLGRLYHFANITDSRAAFVSTKELMAAKTLVEQYRAKKEPPGTTKEQLYRAQKLYQSAFHPDTGELQNVIGRMSFYVPGGTLLIAAMITWYRATAAVIFWQWANQSFNALVNYTNRNAKSPITQKQMAFAYCSATSAALVTAVGLKAFFAKRGGSLIQRFVPLAAVYAAQCINVPFMRQNELINGLPIFDERNIERGTSQLAAVKAISLVIVCRNIMATPPMIIVPMIMDRLEKKKWFIRNQRFLNTPLQVILSAILLAPMIPIGCALFPQKNHIKVKTLEDFELKAFHSVKETGPVPNLLYFNKGL